MGHLMELPERLRRSRPDLEQGFSDLNACLDLGDLVKMQTLIRVRVGPRLCVANNLPGDTDLLVLGPHVEYQVSALKLKG